MTEKRIELNCKIMCPSCGKLNDKSEWTPGELCPECDGGMNTLDARTEEAIISIALDKFRAQKRKELNNPRGSTK